MKGAIVAMALVIGACGLGEAKVSAEKFAEQHFQDDVQSVTCMTRDSDGDGYVSCTVFLKSTPTQPMAIECATGIMSCNSGCRMARRR